MDFFREGKVTITPVNDAVEIAIPARQEGDKSLQLPEGWTYNRKTFVTYLQERSPESPMQNGLSTIDQLARYVRADNRGVGWFVHFNTNSDKPTEWTSVGDDTD